MNLETLIVPGMNVPMVVASSNKQAVNPTSLLSLISEHHAEIIGQLNQYGAVLFRGFACQDEAYFSQAIEACDLGSRCSTKDYDLPRTVLPNEIYTSSDFPGHIFLPLHHEKPRSKNPPNHIYFCCVTPAEQRGGTLFANAAAIWRDIPKKTQDKIIEYGVLYKQFFHGKTMKYSMLKNILGEKSVRSWSEYFGTEDKKTIEKKLAQSEVDWSWINKSNDLILLNRLPGALKHPVTHQILWFNASEYLNFYSNLLYSDLKALPFYKFIAMRYLMLKDSLPMVCHYGNGQAFSSDEIAEIKRIIQHHTCVFNWQKGDFMIVDNYTFMHGKEPHQGDRLLYSCMTQTPGETKLGL
ncbi:TauD/TfdA family dioxygenase [Legionella maioricensis]|uniref:TauD/TfdA family dioxygenase n=1 Tax=Legionella maioricensis TaxID=2896528 RepID=A0A9X2D005_9GAMM|nr:TauD/TfdA family dioxygenase [Legionella maioricensis]MCL9683881.1 TauD/TfdA family dioxygenase [Legionella maioricensis]MCL9686728.1 TauD/TfdA family dioxygenase [Legionella maioricensis]